LSVTGLNGKSGAVVNPGRHLSCSDIKAQLLSGTKWDGQSLERDEGPSWYWNSRLHPRQVDLYHLSRDIITTHSNIYLLTPHRSTTYVDVAYCY